MTIQEYLISKSNSCRELGHILLSDLIMNFSKLPSKQDVIKYAELNREGLKHYPFANLTLIDIIGKMDEA